MKLKYFLIITIIIMFTGCSTDASPDFELSPYTTDDFNSSDYIIETEHPIYSKDIEWISYTISNKTNKNAAYGTQFGVEIYINGKWYVFPLIYDAWDLLAYGLEGYDVRAERLLTNSFQYPLKDGRYRLIKEIGDEVCFAEFEIGESKITADTPFGYKKIENLPEKYTIEEAIDNGDYVNLHASLYNSDKMMEFIEKVKLGIPAMLRCVMTTIEGDFVIFDYIFNKDYDYGYFTIVCDSTRDKFGVNLITQNVYSYISIVTNTSGQMICFSNYVSFDEYSPKGFTDYTVIPSQNSLEELAIVQSIVDKNIRGNITKYKVFSPDCKWDITLSCSTTSKNEFGCETIGFGTTEYVPDEAELLSELTEIQWLDNESFMIIGETINNGRYEALYSISSSELTIQLISYEYK